MVRVGASEALAAASEAHGCAPWLLPLLLRMERSQVGRFGRGGINVKVQECVERAAEGQGPPDGPVEDEDDGQGDIELTSVRLWSFRQFPATELRFRRTPSRPVVVVEASNGYGKSHLVEAVRFALSKQRPAGLGPLLHAHTQDERPKLGVEVQLQHPYLGDVTVRRQATFRRRADGGFEPRRGGLTLTIEVAGAEPLHDQEAEDWLEARIPTEVLDYFVFDAESRVVQQLSGQAGEKLPDVRKQVEAAIGVAPVRRAGWRCHELSREYERRLDAGGTRPVATVTDELKRAREAQVAMSKRLAQLDTTRVDHEKAVERLDAKLRDAPAPTTDWAALEREVLRLEAALGQAESRARAALAGDLPLALLAPLLLPAASHGLDGQALTAARGALERVAEAIVAGRLSWASATDRDTVLADLGRAAELPEEAAAASDLRARIEQAQRLVPDAGELALLRDGPAQLAALAERLAGRPARADDEAFRRAVAEATQQRDAVRAELGRLHQEIGATRSHLAEVSAHIESLDAQLAAARTGEERRTRVTACLEVARTAARAFDAARDELVRGRVGVFEQAATRSLRSLVHKGDLYDRIEVDPETLRYRIVDEHGRAVPPDRSTGERTVLALALVTGLRRASGIRFPLFVEAPLKTLDPVHHELVLREFLCRFEGQTVLLVKPGELDMASQPLVRARVGQLFRIERAHDGQEVSNVVECAPPGAAN